MFDRVEFMIPAGTPVFDAHGRAVHKRHNQVGCGVAYSGDDAILAIGGGIYRVRLDDLLPLTHATLEESVRAYDELIARTHESAAWSDAPIVRATPRLLIASRAPLVEAAADDDEPLDRSWPDEVVHAFKLSALGFGVAWFCTVVLHFVFGLWR